jgi:hypothetical protein
MPRAPAMKECGVFHFISLSPWERAGVSENYPHPHPFSLRTPRQAAAVPEGDKEKEEIKGHDRIQLT